MARGNQDAEWICLCIQGHEILGFMNSHKNYFFNLPNTVLIVIPPGIVKGWILNAQKGDLNNHPSINDLILY